jgi:Flp pilus assembly protein TadD
MARALGDYGRLMVFPANLHIERTVFDPIAYRSHSDWRKANAPEYLSVLGLFLLAAFIFGSVKSGPGQHVRIFGACWFFAAYLPVSNIVQLNATVAEHWLYLPSVGFLIFVVGCALELPRRYWKIAGATALLATAALGARSYVRSTDWVNAETFYRRTIAAGGTNARPGLNLSEIYADRGQYAEAEKILRKVLELAPNYPTAQNNLASALSHEGKTKEAEALFASIEKNSLQTRKEYPRTWIGALNLAHLRYNARDFESAISILDNARKDYPDIWELISFEAEVLRQTQGPEAAQRLVADFARHNWWHHAAALALGKLYAQENDASRAEAILRHASWLDIHDTEALRLIVQMQMRQNRFEDAVQTQRRAVARQPDEPRQYVMLSDILEKMGRSDEARTTLARASRLRALAEATHTGSL